MIGVRVQAQAIDIAVEAGILTAGREDIGAVVSFVGHVRADDGLIALTLEHYPAMTQQQLSAIAAVAAARWPLLGGVVVHRHGRMVPGEAIVLVAIASAHRAAAFEAAAFLMDWLKTRAPFWKVEERAGGRQWVAAKPSDDAAAQRWDIISETATPR
ncbi:MAG: molybdenum cofactor biosynthesis protein MoaE [Sandarakinorhabdus sp.]|nr:molybdenum cofactor biosynthesis protein MoaE [Sandarakinorhabdus sp.]